MANVIRYLLDAVAGTALGTAVTYAVMSIFHLPLLVAASVGALVFVRVFASLIRLPLVNSAPRFVPVPLEFEHEPELLLDQPLAAPGAGSRVVRLFGQAQTPGEMHAAIEHHLRGQAQAAPDATGELREAIAELRRSLG